MMSSIRVGARGLLLLALLGAALAVPASHQDRLWNHRHDAEDGKHVNGGALCECLPDRCARVVSVVASLSVD
jgi:hypothetical protein